MFLKDLSVEGLSWSHNLRHSLPGTIAPDTVCMVLTPIKCTPFAGTEWHLDGQFQQNFVGWEVKVLHRKESIFYSSKSPDVHWTFHNSFHGFTNGLIFPYSLKFLTLLLEILYICQTLQMVQGGLHGIPFLQARSLFQSR